jgi:hypothetical protein
MDVVSYEDRSDPESLLMERTEKDQRARTDIDKKKEKKKRLMRPL